MGNLWKSSAEEEDVAEVEQSESSEQANERDREQVSSSDEIDEEDTESQPVSMRKYPFQVRNPSKTLTYNT